MYSTICNAVYIFRHLAYISYMMYTFANKLMPHNIISKLHILQLAVHVHIAMLTLEDQVAQVLIATATLN